MIGSAQIRSRMLRKNSTAQMSGHDDEEVESRQLRVDVGVGRALHDAPLRRQQVEATQVVAPCLHQHDETQQHGQVRTDGRRHLVGESGRLRPDPSEQEVGDRGEDEHAHQRREEPSLQELEPRQGEDVVGGVAVEQRLRCPERDAGRVTPQQERLPFVGDAEADRRTPGSQRPGAGSSAGRGRTSRGSAPPPPGRG